MYRMKYLNCSNKNWDKIKLGQLIGVPEKSGGLFHYKRELDDFISYS